MGKKILLMIFSMLFISLVACQNDSGLNIENASIELGSPQDPDDRNLHFRVQINDSGMDPQAEYKIRFLIEDSYIQKLVGTESIEDPDTYTTQTMPNDGDQGLVTDTSVELIKQLDQEKIRKIIEEKGSVFVEVYNGNEVFDRKDVDTFREFIKPRAAVTPNTLVETIDLRESNDITLFKKAVSESTKDESFVYEVQPSYRINLGEESYYLWEDSTGRVMNVKDPYTLYSLSNDSLNEIKEIIGQEKDKR